MAPSAEGPKDATPVTEAQNRAVLDAPMPAGQSPIHSDPEIMGGTPVFVGTRVPVETLLDYLEAGDPLDEFLEDFPSVSREQAVAVLELARRVLLQRASATA